MQLYYKLDISKCKFTERTRARQPFSGVVYMRYNDEKAFNLFLFLSLENFLKEYLLQPMHKSSRRGKALNN